MANKYVRQGATGTASGDDWTNAYTTLPASLTRGNTYYIADGSYAAYTFDDAVSSTTLITIKKATASDHGTETGWVSTYGDGQAAFGVWTITTSYWLFDGVFRTSSDWFDGTGYGFKVDDGSHAKSLIISGNPSNITLQYIYVSGLMPATSADIGPFALLMNHTDSGDSTNITWRYLLVNGSSNNMVPWNSTGTLIEYCALDNNWSNGTNHGDPINGYFSVRELTVRYNKIREAAGTALIPVAVDRNTPAQDLPRLFIYGNVFWNFDMGDGSIGFLGNFDNGGNMSNSRIYNNTFVNATANADISAPDGSGNIIRNNLWVTYPGTVGIDSPSSTISHNAISGSSGPTMGTNLQTNVPTSIFTDYTGRVLTLSSNTTSGITLTNETIDGRLHTYDTDMNGTTRVAGSWSRGAYQFTAGDTTPPAAPTGVTIS